MRHLAGDHCANLLGLPPSDWTAGLVTAFARLRDVIDIDDRQTVVERGLGALAQAWMRYLARVERTQKAAPMRLPEGLLIGVVAE